MMEQVTHPCGLVVPISLYEIPSQLHHQLRHYKSDRYSEQFTSQFEARVVSLLAHFLSLHTSCIQDAAGREWDIIVSVPSSQHRPGDHPFVYAINRVASLHEQHESLLEKGPIQIDHLSASDTGYRCKRELSGERILIVDDTFTTGARAQSAASALTLAGGDVVGIVPVGRVIKPEFSETVKEYWDRQRRLSFSFEECCLEEEVEDERDPW